DMAFAHVGDVSRAPLAEADHHAALLLDAAHREPGPAPIAPLLAVDDRQQHFGLHFSDAGPVVLQPALLRRHLRRGIGVLRRAAAAHAEVRAARRAAAGGLAQDCHRPAEVEFRLLPENPAGDALAWQRAFDEHHLALRVARDTASLGVERVDAEDQVFQSDRNSRQCGRSCLSRLVFSRLHSWAYWSLVNAPRCSWKRRYSR